MYGATNLSTVLGARGSATTTLDDARSYGRALAKAGLPVVLLQPGTKKPADWRNTTETKADDAADRKGGVHLATTDTRTLDKYLKRAYADTAKRGCPAPLAEGTTVNWGVRLRGSGYVVADADTPAEVESLKAFLAQDGLETLERTVSTPGTVDGAHSGGGHWWFRLPDDLREAMDAVTLTSTLKVTGPGCEASFSLYVGDAYVLVPPSVRDAGAYSLVAPDVPLPAHLETVLWDEVEAADYRRAAREERAELVATAGPDAADSLDDQLAEWFSATPWAEILQPHGWLATSEVDGCGCPIWTAPGLHGSRKSATTHEPGCTDGRYSMVNPPMHIWTDNPGDGLDDAVAAHGSTLSKLRVLAYLEHGGNESAALDAAGVIITPMGTPLDLDAAGIALPDPFMGPGRWDPETWDNPFWSLTPEFQAVRRNAWRVETNPWLLLILWLAEAALRVPRNVVMSTPSPAAFNYMALGIGESGAGKSTALNAARDMWGGSATLTSENLEIVQFGKPTPQGLIRRLAPVYENVPDPDKDPDKDPEDTEPMKTVRRPSHPVRVRIDEIKRFDNEVERSKGDIQALWTSLFIGEAADSTNVKEDTSYAVDAYDYRCVFMAVGQYGQTRAIFADDSVDMGFTSRLMVAETDATDMELDAREEQLDAWLRHCAGEELPEGTVYTDPEEPLERVGSVRSKGWGTFSPDPRVTGVRSFPTSRDVLTLIARTRLAARRSKDPHSGHLALLQRKTATLLAIVTGATEVTLEHWGWAEYVMGQRAHAMARYETRMAAEAREASTVAKAAERASDAAAEVRYFDDLTERAVDRLKRAATKDDLKKRRLYGSDLASADSRDTLRERLEAREDVTVYEGAGPRSGWTAEYTPQG